jgi:2-dehydro-3-deoxyphosphogluconate aldolase/(4S)-4-hydroxy-2-oxoglutarate aldolase
MTEKATVTGSSLSSTFFDASFAKQRVMAIIRGLPPEETVGLCESAWLAGLELVEVPIQSPDAVASLRAAADAASRRGRRIGVGTVTTPQQVKEALRAGAAFTVAPGFDPEVALASIEAGLPHLPGVASPTEVQRAVGFGFRWLKAFPLPSRTSALSQRVASTVTMHETFLPLGPGASLSAPPSATRNRSRFSQFSRSRPRPAREAARAPRTCCSDACRDA